MPNQSKAYFVTSRNFHGDNDYMEWLKEIKTRYQNIRNRVTLQNNCGAMEFNWFLGRDLVQKKAESRWGSGVVNQLCLDLRAAYPDVRGFSARNLYYMKEWYEFYMADDERKAILHQLGAKLQEAENQNPIKLHQMGAEIITPDRLSVIFEGDGMLPAFGIVPWKHHLVIISKCKSVRLLAMNVLKDPYRLDFLTLEKGYSESDLETAIANDITRFLLELGSGFTYVGRQPELVVGNEGYFPDLLFYHIRLRCYVVIELKVVDFKPEFAGKLNFYVAACNRLLRQSGDNPTIGLLLCKSKDQTKVEWAFDSIQNPMGVATYEGIKVKDKLPSVEDLMRRLDMVEQELKEKKQ